MAKKGQRRQQQARAGRKERRGSPGQQDPVSSKGGDGPGGGHRGLVNLGNTCFLNSVLQCLNVSAPFSDELLGMSTGEAHGGLGSLGGSLCTVFRGIRGEDVSGCRGGAFSPKPLLAQLVAKFPWYKGNEQQDAHELLRTLLGSISDELTGTEKKAEKEREKEKKKGAQIPRRRPGDPTGCCEEAVWNSFRGHLCTAVLCWGCGNVSLRLDPFLDISLELPSGAGDRGTPGPLGVTPLEPVEEAASSSAQAAQSTRPKKAAAAATQDDGDDGENIVLSKRERQERKRKQREEAAAVLEAEKIAKLHAAAEAQARNVVKAAVDTALPLVELRLLARDYVEGLISRGSASTQDTADPAAKDDAGSRAASEAGSLDVAGGSGVGGSAGSCSEKAADSGSEPDLGGTRTVEIELTREGKKDARWGFEWNKDEIASGTLVVKNIIADSILDKWNLKRKVQQEEERAIFVGDRLVSVNEQTDVKAMQKALKNEETLSLTFERGARQHMGGAGNANGSGSEADAEIEAEVAASREDRWRGFCEERDKCLERLPEALRGVFGTSAGNRETNGHIKLESCLQQFSSVEALEDDFKPRYACVECGKIDDKIRTFASKRNWLWPSLPPVLTVQLKRFRRRGTKWDKLGCKVALPVTLDAQHGDLKPHLAADSLRDSPPVEGKSSDDFVFELYGMVVHEGSSMQSGHYVAYVNAGTSLEAEDWVCISDAQVSKCKREKALEAEAYVAFYRRKGVSAAELNRQPAKAADSGSDGEGGDPCNDGAEDDGLDDGEYGEDGGDESQ
eukprot:gnl/TRDRNA2_/TRDRNA2_174896_c2_seq1.p1 gnl/TRDRNA2_/TRDRNA2_174896_c2~~gnl/TRDRNA2_/TRDRNA2_174896_c2_seq1.p1  ORF type:complete len:813 (-),score=213.57 gnl/TRDRNA2_/TRDRNA2_174896_c2_seq1:49-2418(-)